MFNYKILSGFILGFLFILNGLLGYSEVNASNQYFHSLYGQPVPQGVLDGNKKTFLANGYSTTNSPSFSSAWPVVLQNMLDEHTGVTNPQDRIYHVFSHAVGSTPIARWSKQVDDLGCDDDGNLIQDSITWYVNPGTKLVNGAPPASILLAQQSLQWAFDCNDRGVGIADENDITNIEHGAKEIEHFVDQFVAGGFETVYMASHIYQRSRVAVPVYTEKYGLKRALEFVEELKPGPYLWWGTSKQWPTGFQSDGRHPDLPVANAMAIYWYIVLAGDDAKPDIIEKYATQYSPNTHIPSVNDNFIPETISNFTVASENNYIEYKDNDPFSYGLVLPFKPYTDFSGVEFNTMPEYLLNETVYATSNNDKMSDGQVSDFISFDIDQPSTIYVMHNDSITTKPAWLLDFTDTGDDILDIYNSNNIYSVYYKEFSAGEINLGGNDGDGSSDQNMYFFVIKNTETIDAIPVTENDNYSIDEDNILIIDNLTGVLANDTVNEGTLSAEIDTLPSNGQITLNADGSFTYTPNNNFFGIDTFTYKAVGEKSSSFGEVTILVNPVDDPPVAVGDQAFTQFETSIAIDVLSNDIEYDNETLNVVDVTQPLNGSTIINTDNTITYTPNTEFNGTDQFSYTISDGISNADAIVTVKINNPPVADDQNVSLDEDTQIDITLTASDIDNDEITFSINTEPTNGTINGTLPNITYTPNPDYNGTDSIVFSVDDGNFATDTGTISITVNPINDAPIANDSTVQTNQDTELVIALQASDIDSESLDYIILDQPTNGTLQNGTTINEYIYSPTSGFFGIDTFTFKVNDGLEDSNIATVIITINSADFVEIVSVSSGRSYEIVTASLNELPFMDASYYIDNISAGLDNQKMIKTSWNDQKITNDNHITLNFTQDVIVYMVFDKRLQNTPTWMDTSWSFSTESVATSYLTDSPRIVYEKQFSAGEHIFGGNQSDYTKARSNYFMIVVPVL